MTLMLPVPLPARVLLLGSGELGKEVADRPATLRVHRHRVRLLRQCPRDAGRGPVTRLRHE